MQEIAPEQEVKLNVSLASHTIIQPLTMMIELRHAFATIDAVLPCLASPAFAIDTITLLSSPINRIYLVHVNAV